MSDTSPSHPPELPPASMLALGRVVEEHGSRIVAQPARVRGILSDAVGAASRGERSVIDALVIAAEEGVGKDLRQRRYGEDTATDEELLARLEARGLSME